jgi:hypothetical protein
MGAHDDHDMGHTVAGWTGSALVLTGSNVSGIGFAAGSLPALWLGLAVVGLGAVSTWLLHLAGWGKPTGPRPAVERNWRTRDHAARQGHPDCLGCRFAGRRGLTPAPQASPAPVRRREAKSAAGSGASGRDRPRARPAR